jgi:hypothetical protein
MTPDNPGLPSADEAFHDILAMAEEMLGQDYAPDATPWLDPRGFISENRPPGVSSEAAGGLMEELPPQEWDRWGGDLSDLELPQ